MRSYIVLLSAKNFKRFSKDAELSLGVGLLSLFEYLRLSLQFFQDCLSEFSIDAFKFFSSL